MTPITKGINQNDIQEMNQSVIIHLLRKYKGCSRALLAQLSGLKPATLTNIIGDFINWGVVREEGTIDGNKGRRAIGIRLNTDKYRVIGIRLSRRYFLAGLYDIEGTEIEHCTVGFPKNESTQESFSLIKNQIRKYVESGKDHTIIAVGFALPGPFINTEGRIALMSGSPYWQKILIRDELEKEFNIPVFLEHDAEAGAFAEYWGMSCNPDVNLVYIAAGQGIGAGIIINGKIYKGRLGTAGEIGHICIQTDGLQCECGSRGCLEKYCSSIALTRSINSRIAAGDYSLLHENCTFEDITLAVKQNDYLAVDEYTKACTYLAIGILNVVNSFNPDIVVIGDELPGVNPGLLEQIVTEYVNHHVLPEIAENTRIMISRSTVDSALAGAGSIALEEVFKTPKIFQKTK